MEIQLLCFCFRLSPQSRIFKWEHSVLIFMRWLKKQQQQQQKKTIQWIEHQLELVLSSLWLWKWICLVAGTRWSGAGALRLLTFKRRNVANVSHLFSASDSEKKKKISRLIKDEVQVTLVVVWKSCSGILRRRQLIQVAQTESVLWQASHFQMRLSRIDYWSVAIEIVLRARKRAEMTFVLVSDY